MRRFWLVVFSLLLAVQFLFPGSAVRDAHRSVQLVGVELSRPLLYVILAPLSDVLDALSLLTVPQLIALTVTLMLYFALWRWRRARWFGTTRWSECCAALRAFTVYLLLVAMAAVLPRPMAALRV